MRSCKSIHRNLSKLPKTAVPEDKESFVGFPTSFGTPYKFVFYTRHSKIIRVWNGKINSPKLFYSLPLK